MKKQPTQKPARSPAAAVRRGISLGLSAAAATMLAQRRTPERIQDFVSRLHWNHQTDGPTALSVVGVLRQDQAHCIEGAFVAAAALWLAGHRPLLMDLGSEKDDDHVIALFRRGHHWGSISKSNSPFLRYRDPIYRSLRELSLSYFPHYLRRRRKTLRTYSVPIDLRVVDPSLWVTNPGFCGDVFDRLATARHFPLLPAGMTGADLRPIDPIVKRAATLVEYPR
jgi:hypothetical protein